MTPGCGAAEKLIASILDLTKRSKDDGYKAGALGATEFEKRGFHAVYFVITGALGKGSYMDWDACRELEKRGHEDAGRELDQRDDG